MIDDQLGVVEVEPNWTGRVTLTPETDWYGVTYITFFVNDSEYNVTSNNVTLNVSYAEMPTDIIIQRGGGGGGVIEGAKIASLTITVSGTGEIQSYNKTTLTVTLENTGEVALNGVNVSSFVKESDEIHLDLSREYVSQIGIGESVDTSLTITSYNLTKNSYEIRITGSVTDPDFDQSTTIYIKTLFNETKLEKKIQLAKDLFQDNPECLDLTELILAAEEELGKNNLEKAKELTETALENCRDIIRYTNVTRLQKITPEMERVPVNEIIIVLLIIALFTILAYLWLERREEAKTYRKMRKKHGA